MSVTLSEVKPGSADYHKNYIKSGSDHLHPSTLLEIKDYLGDYKGTNETELNRSVFLCLDRLKGSAERLAPSAELRDKNRAIFATEKSSLFVYKRHGRSSRTTKAKAY